MSSHTLVCPPVPELLERLNGSPVVFETDDLGEARALVDSARSAGVGLRCIRVHSDMALADQDFECDLEDIPIALYVPSAGPIRDVLRLAPTLRTLDLRVYLPAESEEACIAIRILTTLGIECSVLLPDGRTDWESLQDLAAASLLGQVEHAPIEPFRRLSEHFDPRQQTGFRVVYFDDPSLYLHVDADGRVALSRADLIEERFLSLDLDGIDELAGLPEYDDRVNAWRQSFLEATDCSTCPGWRICMGDALAPGADTAGCKTFFTELLELLELRQAKQAERHGAWQP